MQIEITIATLIAVIVMIPWQKPKLFWPTLLSAILSGTTGCLDIFWDELITVPLFWGPGKDKDIRQVIKRHERSNGFFLGLGRLHGNGIDYRCNR